MIFRRLPAPSRASIGVLLAASLAVSGHMQAAARQPSAAPSASASSTRAVLTRYCVGCHTQAQKALGAVPMALDGLDLSDVGADAAAWEKVVRKLRAGVMPPPGRPRPDKATHEALVAWLETELDRVAARTPNPGRTEPFHRLNRAEYQNAIRDLLDLEIDVTSLLPPDDASYGFDNIAGVLKLSPTLLERYLSASQKLSRVAVGLPPSVPAIEYFRVSDDLTQDTHLDPLPFGTRGGTAVRYAFPMDAEYEIRVRLARDLNESVPVYTEPQPLEISIDGERVGLFTLPGVQGPSAPTTPDQDQAQAPPPPLPVPPAPGPPGSAQRPATPPPRPQISQIQQGIRAGPRERELRNRADESWNLRIPVKAGTRQIAVTFLNRTSALEETVRLPFVRPYPSGVNIPETRGGAYLRGVEISGPHDPRGPGEAPSRRRIFVCRPVAPVAESGARGSAFAKATADKSGNGDRGAGDRGAGIGDQGKEVACAKTILSKLARRAYRRPVTEADLKPLLAFYHEGRTAGAASAGASFDAGIERALRRLLVSPEFLFRIERDPAKKTASHGAYRINDLELASRLSFFLWSSIPDDELLDVAVKGQLGNPAVLGRQVRRMVADRRSTAFVNNFAGQWLFLRNLPATGPVQYAFPDFDDSLRRAFQRETELFVDSIVRDDRSALDLLRADYTFLNERLARHYGIPNVKGSHFRRVTLAKDSVRGGLLGQGSVLTVTSYPDRTSPVVRGKWILENLLGTPPPPPIPNVPALKPTDVAGTVLSMRERMAQHRADPVCASCHALMDPLGLALENFDAVGKWRTLGESGAPVDASGVFPDGTRFAGPAGLEQALLQSDRFMTTLTEKLMTYALGRGLEYYDAPAVRSIVREAGGQDYRFSSLIMAIVKSAPFQMRKTI